MNSIEALYENNPEPKAFAEGYLSHLSQVLKKLDSDSIAAFIKTLWEARERGARIFFLGNGGSAATASHFANDIAIGTRSLAKPFRALSLTDNVAVLTAIANDYGYDEIFAQQLKALMLKGDVVVAISASGNSPNVIKAVEYANSAGGLTVGLTGFDGGALRRLAQVTVHVPTDRGEFGPVEDMHMVLDHLVGAYLQLKCRTAR